MRGQTCTILPRARHGFTLAEIMVSVGVLIAILVVAGRVFNTAQQVSNVGAASADVLQETIAIERQIREDVARMSPQGVVAIRSTEVRNDQRITDWRNSGGQGIRPGLINPNLDALDTVRCDQLVFFTDGISRVKQFGSDGFVAPNPSWFPKILGEGSMISYGHALQFPELKACNLNPDPDDANQPPILNGHDVDFAQLRANGIELAPWFNGGTAASVPTLYREYPRASTNDNYEYFTIAFLEQAAPDIIGTQPEARNWVLARQETVLGDDDSAMPGTNNKRIYLSRAFGAKSVFPVDPRWNGSFGSIHFETMPLLECGRVDLAGMRFSGVREALSVSRSMSDPNGVLPANRAWDSGDINANFNRDVMDPDDLPGIGDEQGTQRELVKSLVRWPRAERVPPGEGRFDQHLTIPTLGSACSSFIVEWTWDEGVGDTDTEYVDPQTGRRWDRQWVGLRMNPADSWDGTSNESYPSQRWFGMYDADRQVMPFGDLGAAADTLGWDGFAELFPPDTQPRHPDLDDDDWTQAPSTVRVDSIEELNWPGTFGDPTEVPHEYWAVFGLNNTSPLHPEELSDMTDGLADHDMSYTPWPTALRFTMVLHDPGTRLENGQVVQFVVRLPERSQP